MSSTVLRILAILLAIGAIAIGYLGYRTSQQPPKQAPARVETMQPKGDAVVFAVRDISAGQIIEAEDLTTGLVPTRPVRSYSSESALVGRKSRVDIAAGEMLLSSHFPVYSQLARSLRNGERAVAVKVDEVLGVGGFIEPGDHVDVLLYLRAGNETGKDSSAQVILSNVRVLAFGNMLETFGQHTDGGSLMDSSSKESAGGIKSVTDSHKKMEPTGKKSKTAVLAIAEADAPTLMLAESGGKLRLALRGVERVMSVAEELKEGSIETDYSYAGPEHDQENKYHVVLNDLARPSGSRSRYDDDEEGFGYSEQTDIVIHRGNSIETLTLRR